MESRPNPSVSLECGIFHADVEHTKKSWMDSILFEGWIRELDSKFERESRKIVLIVDNCPAHPRVKDLKAINLVFLPPSTTSKMQPMDQGIIALKAHNRTKAVQMYITANDNKHQHPCCYGYACCSMGQSYARNHQQLLQSSRDLTSVRKCIF